MANVERVPTMPLSFPCWPGWSLLSLSQCGGSRSKSEFRFFYRSRSGAEFYFCKTFLKNVNHRIFLILDFSLKFKHLKESIRIKKKNFTCNFFPILLNLAHLFLRGKNFGQGSGKIMRILRIRRPALPLLQLVNTSKIAFNLFTVWLYRSNYSS